MTAGNWYPPGIYRFLLDIASKHDLSTKEVETVFLRRQARDLGFECFHQKVGLAKSDGKPFCKDCWTRLEQTRPPTFAADSSSKKPHVTSPAKYRPLRTFLDEIEEEKTRRATFANPTNPDPADPVTTLLPNEND